MYKKGNWIVSGLMGVVLVLLPSACTQCSAPAESVNLVLNDSNHVEARGLNIFIFNHSFDAIMNDTRMAGIEIVHHGVRSITNGDVRFYPTPEPWDLRSTLIERKIDREKKVVIAQLKYDDPHFAYQIQGRLGDGGVYISVWTDQHIPDQLVGIAGLNLEFVPTPFFGQSYMMDGAKKEIPRYPDNSLIAMGGNRIEPMPIASGRQFDMAPDDATKHISVSCSDQDLMLYDGRQTFQNGRFVLRSLLPPDKSGKVIEWFISVDASTEKNLLSLNRKYLN